MIFNPARRWLLSLLLLAGPALPWAAPAAATDNAEVTKLPGNISLVTVQARKKARQPFLVLEPQRIDASVILFAGGSGNLGLAPSGSLKHLGGNFLLRSRDHFLRQNLMVAIVDTPSDRSSLDKFRAGKSHARDIQAVIAWLRQAADAPVWLVGTSRGAISAAGVAGRLEQGGPDGIVLTSTLFGPSKRGSVFDAKLESIRQPVLLVHHKNDACEVTPYRKTRSFRRKLPNAAAYELIGIEGGVGDVGKACGGNSAHGFLGQEARVVELIADWIKSH